MVTCKQQGKKPSAFPKDNTFTQSHRQRHYNTSASRVFRLLNMLYTTNYIHKSLMMKTLFLRKTHSSPFYEPLAPKQLQKTAHRKYHNEYIRL